jgi:hypothetical protein
MLQALKKTQDKEIKSTYNESFFAVSVLKAKNKTIEQWKQYKEFSKDYIHQNFNMLQKIDGISLWKINRQLNGLAIKGISKEQLQKGLIIIQLPAKPSDDAISSIQKEHVEKTIDELEGFENLRLSHFYHYEPIYIEKKTVSEITRWIEIKVTEM